MTHFARAHAVSLAAVSASSLTLDFENLGNFRMADVFLEGIPNPNTRRAYRQAVAEFLLWCSSQDLLSITDVEPAHVSEWIETQICSHSAVTARLRLAAIRHLFKWLLEKHLVRENPAESVPSPRPPVSRGKTPMLNMNDALSLLERIDVTTVAGMRDRALIGLMVYSSARTGAALGMHVEDVFHQEGRLWVQFSERNGKTFTIACQKKLEVYLRAYLSFAGVAKPGSWLFRTIKRGTGQLSSAPLPQASAYAMIQRRAGLAGIKSKVNNNNFRTTELSTHFRIGMTRVSGMNRISEAI
ncbi:MAG TPA: site-specific integrase [Acidobacteriaceae bacterium]|nr:site-specific integrase [Acidobacteriaceae bacterium]